VPQRYALCDTQAFPHRRHPRGVKHTSLLHLSTRAAWRAWLAEHHATHTEVWLAYAKKHTEQPRVAYADAVEEALCFGWIDGLVHAVDDAHYAQRFTPRRPRSKWSELNRKRFRKMTKEGLMTPAGLAKSPPRRGGTRAETATSRTTPLEVPAYIAKAFARNKTVARSFERLAPSHRRMYVRWIDSAVKDDTKQRRIAEAMARIAKRLPVGLK
jgi:uncharacterized protein YdeI (YjbR/CyaY-like superfamily)